MEPRSTGVPGREPGHAALSGPEPHRFELLKGRHLWLLSVLLISALSGAALLFTEPSIVVGGVLALFFGVVLLSQPFLGLMVLLLIMVVQPGELVTTLAAFHVERVAAGLVIISVIMERRHSGRPLRLWGHPLLTAMYVFLGALVASFFTSIWPGRTADWIMGFVRTMSYCLLIINVIPTSRRLTLLMRFFMLLHTYLAVMTLHGYYAGQIQFAQGIERAVGLTSFGGDPNNLAATLVAVMPFMILGIRVEKRFWWRAAWSASILMLAWTVVLTGSRSGFLGLLYLSILIWLMSPHKLRNLLAVLLLAVAVWSVMPQQYRTRYLTIGNKHLDDSSLGRIEAWKAGWQMYVEHPFFGVGAGAFGLGHAQQTNSVDTRGGNWLQAHSLYFQLIAEIGTVGILGFGFFVLSVLRWCGRLMRKFPLLPKTDDYRGVVARGALFAIIGLLMSGIFGHNLYRITWYLLASFLLVADTAVEKEEERVAPVIPAQAPLEPVAGPA